MITFLLFILTQIQRATCDELVLVQTVFRHGDRAPMGGTTSPEAESYYFRGKEHLTNKGIEQAHKLGLSLRRRYVDTGFLDGRYLPSEVVFRSSTSERCLMTASAASSAMFNLTDSGLPTVLPIFTVPRADDYVCVPRIDCPFVLEEMRTTLGVRNVSPSIGSLLSELFRQEAERLNYTHVTGSRLRLFEPLFLEHDSGLAVPQWFNDDARKEADHLLDLTIEFLSGTGAFHRPRWILTRSGKLLSTLLGNQRAAMQGRLNGTKFFAFSTHDATISALLESFGILRQALAPQGRPDFTSAVSFELFRNSSEYYVKVLYRSGVISDDFVDLTSSIEECGGLDGCPVELIERATKEFRTDSPHELCKIDDVVDDEKDSISFGRSQLLTILLMIATGVFAMLFLATLCLLMRYRPASDSKVEDISTPEFKRTPTSC